MGVTFMLPREYRVVTREDEQRARSLPCPTCGGHDCYSDVADKVEGNLDCPTCYGDGGNLEAVSAIYGRRAEEDGEFDVANANAIYIVQDLLNLPHTEVYGGSLAPHDVLIKLSTVFDTSRDTIEPSETQAVRLTSEGVSLGCTVVNLGRSQRQCDSYVSRLRKLAEIAIERGAPEIYWG